MNQGTELPLRFLNQQRNHVLGIAAVAWRHQVTLLACDADLHHVARIIGMGLDESSRPDQR
jgi:hypothetical protein